MARDKRGRSGKSNKKKGGKGSSRTNTPEASNRDQKQEDNRENEGKEEGENKPTSEAPSPPNEDQQDPSSSSNLEPSEVEPAQNASQSTPATSQPKGESESGVSTKSKHNIPESIPFHSSGGKVTPAAKPSPLPLLPPASYRGVSFRPNSPYAANLNDPLSETQGDAGEGSNIDDASVAAENTPDSAGHKSQSPSSAQSTPGIFQPLRGRRVDPSLDIGPTVEVNPRNWTIPARHTTPPNQRASTPSPSNRRSTYRPRGNHEERRVDPAEEAALSPRPEFQDDPFGPPTAGLNPEDSASDLTLAEEAALARGRGRQDDPDNLYNEDSNPEDSNLPLTLAEELEFANNEATEAPSPRPRSSSFVVGDDYPYFGPPLERPQVGSSSSAQAPSQGAPRVEEQTTFQIVSEPIIVARGGSSNTNQGASASSSNAAAAPTDGGSKSSGKNNNQGSASKSFGVAAAPGDPGDPGDDSDSDEDRKKKPRSNSSSPPFLPRRSKKSSDDDEDEEDGDQGSSSKIGLASKAPQKTKDKKHDSIFEPPIHARISSRAVPGIQTSRAHVFREGDPPRYQTEPDSEEELARKELELEERLRADKQPQPGTRTTRELKLEEHKQDLQQRAGKSRSIPHTIRQWRKYAQKEENKHDDWVGHANAAIDDALAIGTEQTRHIIEVGKEIQRLEDENNALKNKLGDGYEERLAKALKDLQKEQSTTIFLQNKSRKIEEAARKLEQEKKALAEGNQVLETLNEQQKREAFELAQRNQELVDTIGPDPNIAATLKSLQEQVADLSSENKSLRKDNDSLSADLLNCRNQTKNLQSQPSTPKTGPKTPPATEKNRGKELEDLKKRVADLEKDLTNTQHKAQSAKFRSIDETANLQRQLLDANESIKQLNIRLTAEKSQNVDARKDSKEIADLKRTKAALNSKSTRLEQMLLDKVTQVRKLKLTIQSKLYKSIDVTGHGWDGSVWKEEGESEGESEGKHDGSEDSQEKGWLGIRPTPIDIKLDDEHPDTDVMINPPSYVELMINRIRLALFNLVNERATHGIREDDGNLLVGIAEEVYHIAQSGAENVFLARACFWHGIAQYYAGNGGEASSSFMNAEALDMLPQDEKDLVQGWITRAADSGPAEEANAYGGADITDSKTLDREAMEVRLKEERKLQAMISKANNSKLKLKRKEERHRRRMEKSEMVHKSKLKQLRRKGTTQQRTDGNDSEGAAVESERKLKSKTSRRDDERIAAEKNPEAPSASSDKKPAESSWPVESLKRVLKNTFISTPHENSKVQKMATNPVDDIYDPNSGDTEDDEPYENDSQEVEDLTTEHGWKVYVDRVLSGRLAPNERIPDSPEELFGVSGLGKNEPARPEGSDEWVYGQRILEEVFQTLIRLKVERQAHLAAKPDEPKEPDEVQKQRKLINERIDEWVPPAYLQETREVIADAEQAYIRDTKYFGRKPDALGLVQVASRTLIRWIVFNEKWDEVKNDRTFKTEFTIKRLFKLIEASGRYDALMKRTEKDNSKLSRPEYRDVAWFKYYHNMLYEQDPEAMEALGRTRILMKSQLSTDADLGIEICEHNNEESWGREEILHSETVKGKGKDV